MQLIVNKINSTYKSYGWSANKQLDRFDEDETHLIEDLAQFYKSNITIDFGFYGDGTEPEDGNLVIYVVQDYDWVKPLARFEFLYSCSDFALETLEKIPSTELFP